MHLSRCLNRPLNRRLGRFVTKRTDGRAFRPPNHLKQVCDIIAAYLRLRDRAAKREPHLFGPHAHAYFLETLQLEKREQEIESALNKVYGPPPPDVPERISTLWSDQYFPKTPLQQRIHRKWFKEKYGST